MFPVPASTAGYIDNNNIGTNFVIVSPTVQILGVYIPGQYLIGNLGGSSYKERVIPFRALTYASNNVSLPASGLVSDLRRRQRRHQGGGDRHQRQDCDRPAGQTDSYYPAIGREQLAQYRTAYLNAVAAGGVLPNPIHDIPGLLSAVDAATQGRGTAVYDAANNRIVITDTNASSSGGRLTMNGAIISTSTLGNIEVNGGLGQVTIDNQTSIAMVVNKVNTGSLAEDGKVVSTVKITDTLRPKAPTQRPTATPRAGRAGLHHRNGADPTFSGPKRDAGFVVSSTPCNTTRSPARGWNGCSRPN